MPTKIQKWGNSLAVRLPKETARRLAIKQGTAVLVRESENAIIISKQDARNNRASKDDWTRYLISTHRKKENVSKTIDTILYGAHY